MGWRDYLKPDAAGLLSFCPFVPEVSLLNQMSPSETKIKKKENLLLLSNNYNSHSHPLGQNGQKDKRPVFTLVWTNPFPKGSREAREESLRVVAEAIAETESRK